MKERPILFSGPMVRALLAGTKTQTRRLVKPSSKNAWLLNGGWDDSFVLDPENRLVDDCPYGHPGDSLWVRETWMYRFPEGWSTEKESTSWCQYRADGEPASWWTEIKNKWRPSIFMPRWASRITLEVTGVRVERLQDISEADAKAEGAELLTEYLPMKVGFNYRQAYGGLWESINGPGSWDANPWVWVVEFKRIGGNHG